LEPFPDLSTLSDKGLRDLIHDFERQENEISYQRRLLHGKIGLLRAELVARYQKKGEGSLGVDIDKLSTILAGKGPAIDDIDIGEDIEHGADADEEGGPGAAA
jgi:hypothetical protein